MSHLRIPLALAALLSCVLSQHASADITRLVPKPFVIAPVCTPEQASSAISILGEVDRVVGCFFLEKWSFKGAAVATAPSAYDGRDLTSEEFRQLRKQIFREQSVRLRSERDMTEAMPGEPPTHASTPISLFVRQRTPLGVFMDEPNHIGFADLVPLLPPENQGSQQDRYPLIQLESWVFVNGHVIKLTQISPIRGMSTIGEGFRMADDWARRLNGSERLASED